MRAAEVTMLVAAAALLLKWYRDRCRGHRLGHGPRPALPWTSGADDARKDDDDGKEARDAATRQQAPTAAQGPNSDGTRPKRDAAVRLKHERLGHVVVVRERLDANRAAAFAATFKPPVHVVLLDTRGIAGELRLPDHEVLFMDKEAATGAAKQHLLRVVSKLRAHTRQQRQGTAADGQSQAVATFVADSLRGSAGAVVQASSVLDDIGDVDPCLACVTEQGTQYLLASDKVMFCSGNMTERTHFKTQVKCRPGEIVVDMFAGIGYFTLPLACTTSSPPAHVVAIEKNPLSAQLLSLNVVLNGVADRVTILNGDNREVGDELLGCADRVVMGYIPDCTPFLPRAVAFLRRKRRTQQLQHLDSGSRNRSSGSSASIADAAGTVHFHFLAPSKAGAYSTAHSLTVAALGEDAVEFVSVAAVRVVKSFAPRKFHCVADLRVGSRFAE